MQLDSGSFLASETYQFNYIFNHKTVYRTAILKRKLSPLHATFAVFVACPPAQPLWQPQHTTVGLPSIPALLPLPLPHYLFLLSPSLAFFLSCPRRRQSPIAHNDYVLGGRSVWQRAKRWHKSSRRRGEGERERESIIPSFVKTRQCDEAAAARNIYLDTRFCPLVNITFLIKVATNDNTLQQFSNFYANLYSEHHIERI